MSDKHGQGKVRGSARSNTERIIKILSAFGHGNEPQATSELLARLGFSKSTGFGLIRAMIEHELIERVDHGTVRLGVRARMLAFSPSAASYYQRISDNGKTTTIPTAGEGSAIETRLDWDERLAILTKGDAFVRKPPHRIAVSNASLSNPWRYALVQSVRYAARINSESISAVDIMTAEDDVELQCHQIDQLMEKKPDALIVSASPDEQGKLSDKLRSVLKQGISVVSVDRRPRDSDASISFVTASDITIGKISALWISEWLNGKGRIWMLSGLKGASPTIRRQSAAMGQFLDYGDIEVEAVTHTGWTQQGGHRAVLRLLEKYGNPPDGVWCDSGLQGVGSMMAFSDLGMAIPPHTGGDLNLMYKKALLNHVPFVAVDYPATMGSMAVSIALSIMRGEPVPKRVETPLKVVLPRGCETRSVKADEWAQLHVRWDLDDNTILSQGPGLRNQKNQEVQT